MSAVAEAAQRRAEDMAAAVDLLLKSVPAIDDLVRLLEAASGSARLVAALRAELAVRRRTPVVITPRPAAPLPRPDAALRTLLAHAVPRGEGAIDSEFIIYRTRNFGDEWLRACAFLRPFREGCCSRNDAFLTAASRQRLAAWLCGVALPAAPATPKAAEVAAHTVPPPSAPLRLGDVAIWTAAADRLVEGGGR
jgi:hypothetical protein